MSVSQDRQESLRALRSTWWRYALLALALLGMSACCAYGAWRHEDPSLWIFAFLLLAVSIGAGRVAVVMRE
jgi:hypothetical protein